MCYNIDTVKDILKIKRKVLMKMEKELGTIINELIGKELSTTDRWIYKIVAQILVDICNGFEDSTTILSNRLCPKEIEDILEFFDSMDLICRIEYAEEDSHLLVFSAYWGREE